MSHDDLEILEGRSHSPLLVYLVFFHLGGFSHCLSSVLCFSFKFVDLELI